MRLSAKAVIMVGVVALSAAMPMVGGCGGAGRGGKNLLSGSTRAKGTANVTVTWPEPSRLIPLGAESILVTLTYQPGSNAELPASAVPAPRTTLLRRPQTTPNTPLQSPTQTTATFTGLELGTYTVTAVAYATTSGPTAPPPPAIANTTPQASGSAPLVIKDDQPTPLTVTMGTTIATAAITQAPLPATDPDANGRVTLASSVNTAVTDASGKPLGLPLRGGDRLRFTVTSRDGSGALVLTASGEDRNTPFRRSAITWSIGDENGGTPSGNVPFTIDPVTGALKVDDDANIQATQATRYTIKATNQDAANPAIASFVVNVSPSGQVNKADAWARFHADNQNTGKAFAGVQLTTNPTVPASFPLRLFNNEAIQASPVLSKDGTTLYIAVNNPVNPSTNTYNGRVFAYDLQNNRIKWQFPTEDFSLNPALTRIGGVRGTPAVDRNGVLYFGDSNGLVYAVKDTGPVTAPAGGGSPTGGPRQLWSVNMGGSVKGSPTIDQRGYVYVGTEGGTDNFYKIDSLKGAVVWKAPIGGGIASSPALSARETGGTASNALAVYVTGVSGDIYAVDATTGPEQSTFITLWSTSVGQGIRIEASPVVFTTNGREQVYVGATDGTLRALDAITGAIDANNGWLVDLQAPILSTPAIQSDLTNFGTDVLYVATFDLTSGTNNSKVRAIQAGAGAVGGGTIFWEGAGTPAFGVQSGFASSPALTADGKQLIIGSNEGNVYLFNTDGTNAFAPGTLPVQNTSAANGGQVVQYDSSPSIGPDGTVYFGNSVGTVYAFKP